MTIELKEGEQASINRQNPYALVAITKHGVELSRRLHKIFAQTDLYYMDKFARGDEEIKGIQLFSGSVRLLLPSLFQHYKGMILIISLGAVVRMIAPLIKDKKTDPAVVVIDDRGENVISVLSGHLGGANELTREAAQALKARAVITTASDVQKTIPVDLFGSRFGWVWDSDKNLTSVSASVVNEEHVAIVQESGEPDWWMYDTPLPKNIIIYDSIHEALKAKPHASLIITHRLLLKDEEALLKNGIVFRPKSVAIGIGCNRETSTEEIETVIFETLNELRISHKSIKALCTIDLKKDERGLLEVTDKYGWEFVCYAPDTLNKAEIQAPSETVYKYTGAYGVSEPAVRIYTGAQELELVKKKSGNVTISVGVISFSKEEFM